MLKIMHESLTYAVGYFALIIYAIFFYRDEQSQEKVLHYVPKSQRSNEGAWVTIAKTWLYEQKSYFYERIAKMAIMQQRQAKLRRAYVATKRFHKTTRKQQRGIVALAAIAMQAGSYANENQIQFDTDSEPIGIDNRCTGCISHKIEDFDGPLIESDRSIKGFGGSRTTNVKIGTITWKWIDDQGMTHKFVIPKSFYVPEGNVRLLSPQHWAQAQRDKTNGTGSETLKDKVTLFWNNRKYKLTVPLGKDDNVATLYTAPGFRKFESFCATAGIDYEQETANPIIATETLIVSDDDQENDSFENLSKEPQEEDWCQPIDTTFEFQLNKGTGPAIIEAEDDESGIKEQPTSNAAELLRYHHAFGHVSFLKLKEMAKMGTIPKKLANCPVPACSSCLYAKAIKRKWRSRTANNRDEATRPTRPGERVSVDQLVSPTPGLIAQMAGFLTTKRYKYATIYVDQASRLSFVYLQKTATADETLLGKEAFEQYSKDRGVNIEGYHADNGIFRANKWVTACQLKGQGLSFAGVNAHHQNGIAERRIRTLQELARTMLIHAAKRWPKAVTTNLWPYAIRMANDVLNETPHLQDKTRRTAQQIFSNTAVQTNPKHWKPFGCPVFVLDRRLQAGSSIFHKWKQRAKVGIYLGRSPQHARSVALVLDRRTALVSPQFHVHFDPSFQTVKQDEMDSQWQLKAGFVTQKEIVPPVTMIPTADLPTNKRKTIQWNLPSRKDKGNK